MPAVLTLPQVWVEPGGHVQLLDAPLRVLHDALFLEPNPIPVKWAMSDQGWIERGIRLPMTELAEPFRARVRAALDAARGQLPLARAKSA